MIYIIIYFVGLLFATMTAAWMEAIRLVKMFPYETELSNHKITLSILWYVFWPIGFIVLVYSIIYFRFLNLFFYLENNRK
jgi:hypothetical protein